MVQSIPLFSLSTEWRAGGPHWHCKWSRRPTLTVAVHCAYFVSPALALQVEPKAHTQSGEVSTVCGMEANSWREVSSPANLHPPILCSLAHLCGR